MSFRINVACLLFTGVLGALALPAQTPSTPPAAAPQPATAASRADAYVDFTLARHEELLGESEGGSYIDDALEHLREAMHADPDSVYLPLQMADLLFRTGRSGDAIRMAQSVVAAHSDSIEAHELLGEIYMRLAGGSVPGQTSNVVTLAVAEYQTLVRLDPGNADYPIVLGRLYHAQGQDQQAEQELRDALRIDSGSEAATGNLVLLLSDEGKLDEARTVLDTAPESARSSRAYALLAQAYSDHKQYQDAVDTWRKAVAMTPDDTDMQHSLAQALLDSGDVNGARQAFQHLADTDPSDGDNYLRLAQIEQQMGDLTSAARNMQTAQKLLPADPEVAYYSAALSEAQGHGDAAIATLRGALDATARPDGHYSADESNNRAILLDRLASVQLHQGNTDDAFATYRQLEALGGQYQDQALAEEIQAYVDRHNYTQAADVAQTELNRHPDSHPLRIEYANLLALTGKTDDALAALQPLLADNAGAWDAYVARAEAEQSGHRWPEAEADARKAGQLAASDTNRAQALDVLGSIQEGEKSYDQAEASFKQALSLDPGNPEYLNNLGYMLADRGTRLPEALGYIQQAVAREPNNGAYLDSLGWAYFKLNRYDEARTHLEQAAKLQQGDPTVLDHLAQAYLGAGDLQHAADSWQQALVAWDQTAPADRDAAEQAAMKKNLDAVRARLAQHQP